MRLDCAFFREKVDGENCTVDCKALEVMACWYGKKCSFYKTWQQYKDGLAKWGGLKDENL
jgi:hypothetical protein